MRVIGAIVRDGFDPRPLAPYRARFGDALKILRDIDRLVIGKAFQTVKRSFLTTEKITRQLMKDVGYPDLRGEKAEAYHSYRDEQIAAILALLSFELKRGTKQMRDKVIALQQEARRIRLQRNFIDEGLQNEGGSKQLIQQMLRGDEAARRKGRAAGGIFHQISELPYVQNGKQKIRIDKYVEQIINARVGQAKAVSQRVQMLRSGHQLVRISLNEPLEPDACTLYVGKVFALTHDGAKEHGVPHVSQLPNGGPPFHPNCRHFEIPFFPQMEPVQELNELAMIPPPAFALSNDYDAVQRKVKEMGDGLSKKQLTRKLQSYNEAAQRFEYVIDSPEGLRARKKAIVGEFRSGRPISTTPTKPGKGITIEVSS